MADYKVGIELTADTARAREEFGRFTKSTTDKVKEMSDRSVSHLKRLEDWFSKNLGGAIGKIGASLLNLKTLAVGALAGWGIERLAGSFIETASGFDKMKLSLDTITKGKGEEWFKKLNEWAMKMPVNTQKAIQTFIMMSAMGLQPSINQMTILVDTMSALGGGEDTLQGIGRALGQIATKGKVSAEELMQLAEQGVPVFDILKKKFGDVEVSSLDARAAIAAIFEGLEERFGGQSKKLEKTWAGMVESLKGYWTEFQRLVMESGVMQYLEETLGKIVGIIDKMYADGSLKKWAKEAGDAIIEAMKGGYDATINILKAAGWLYDRFKEIRLLADILINLFARLLSAGANAVDKVAQGLARGTRNIPGVGALTSAVAAGTGVAAGAFGALAESSGAVLDEHLSDYAAGSNFFDKAAEGMENFRDAVKEADESVTSAKTTTAQFFDYAAAAAGEDPFTLTPKISMSPAQPWASGIAEMQRDLEGVGGKINSTLDLAGVGSLLTAMQASIRQTHDYGPMSDLSTYNAYAGFGEKQAYKDAREVVDMQKQLFKQLIKGGGGAGTGGGRSVQIGTVNINLPAGTSTQTGDNWRMIVREHIIPELNKVM